jgi:two-component system, OmpR family, KDP operon response regulator KdpE
MTAVTSGWPEGSQPAGRPVPRILVVEDQAQLLRALEINLRARQYEVLTARTGREALATAAATPPDAMILDLGLPDVDGTEVIVAFRGWSRAPIIVLSGRTSPGDKIGALDAGADDYVTKPFAMGELLARLRAALRRDEEAGHDSALVATIGDWSIDLAAHTIQNPASETVPDASPPPRLTPTEWRILEILLRRPGQLVGSAQLLSGVWEQASAIKRSSVPLGNGAERKRRTSRRQMRRSRSRARKAESNSIGEFTAASKSTICTFTVFISPDTRFLGA